MNEYQQRALADPSLFGFETLRPSLRRLILGGRMAVSLTVYAGWECLIKRAYWGWPAWQVYVRYLGDEAVTAASLRTQALVALVGVGDRAHQRDYWQGHVYCLCRRVTTAEQSVSGTARDLRHTLEGYNRFQLAKLYLAQDQWVMAEREVGVLALPPAPVLPAYEP